MRPGRPTGAVAHRAALAIASVSLLACTGAIAAGGHHAVDDAALLDTGSCELDSWFTRAASGGRLLHAAAACRVGPAELGLAAERAQQPTGDSSVYGAQLKWARDWGGDFSAGLSLSPFWQTQVRPRHRGTTVTALFTWAAFDGVALHANLGRDFMRGSPNLGRSGVALEWTPRPGWSLVAERHLEQETHFARAGLRWAVADNWRIDLSRARRLHGSGVSNWTLGTTWLVGRP